MSSTDTIQTRTMQFACDMFSRIKANAGKGDWERWAPPVEQLIYELEHALDELKLSLCKHDAARVSEQAADVANLCMKAAEIHGKQV